MIPTMARNAAVAVADAIRRSPRRAALVAAAAFGAWQVLAPGDNDDRRAAREVLATVRTWPEGQGSVDRDASRRLCRRVNDESFIDGLGFLGNVDRRRMALPTPDYDANTAGAYFGGGPRGVTPSPFLQALMDAGVVRRVPVTIVTRTHQPTAAALGYVPLQDTIGGPLPPPPTQQFEDTESRMDADLFIAPGDGAAWFIANPDLRKGLMGIAPASTPRIVPVRDGSGNAAVPPGLVTPDGICYPLRADRVLEYTDAKTVGYKLREITVAILMKPRTMPGWVSDPRVFGALMGAPVLPEDVRVWTFRNAGDGWRLSGLTDMRDMASNGHYLGE